MVYEYLLNFHIRDQSETVQFEVREPHWLRAQELFDRNASFYSPARFLTFDTVDGLSVAVGFADVQIVRFLYNRLEFPSDPKHKDDDVRVWLRGHKEPVAVRIDTEKEALAAFFIALDTGAEFGQFPALIDEDGEIVRFNADDLVMVTAPSHEVREGHQKLLGDDLSHSADDSEDIPF